MEYTKLRPSELTLAIEDAILSDIVLCILGRPGSGKSQIVQQTVARMKRKLVDERTSTMDLTDWRGVPDIDRERGRTIWYPPAFLPTKKDGPTVVFFDEITQTPTQCQPPLYQLLLDRKLGTTYAAPPDTRFITAGNLQDDGTFVQRIGSALRDRMVRIQLEPNLDDWCRWAYANGIAPVVIAYNRWRPTNFSAFDKNEWASPTPRGWEMVSKIVLNAKSNGKVRQALIEGKIGHAVANEFVAFEQIFSTLPNIDAIVLNPDVADTPPESKPDLAYAISNALSMNMTVKNMERILIYLERLPEEFGVFAVKCALRRDPKLAHTPGYTKWTLAHASAMN